ncbi:MAG TPA: HAMP domain-containing sensor histidine kinase [Gaiella sp.]|nr:HAMP domain-containing sensor histidine kinase [Gaiella sp.]
MRRPRLGVRARLLLAVVAAVVLALAIGVTAFTLLLSHRLSASATSLARAQAQAAVSSLDVRGGRLSAHEAPDQGASPGQVWVFADKRQVEAPNASRVVAAAARALAGGPERTETVEEQTRLYALPVVDNGRRFGTVVSAVALDPYEDTERTAFVGALILAALLLAAVAVLSRWMLGRALEPVSRMTADAAAWRASDLDRRFALGEPYDELTRLAATLDDLLEQIAASLRHEQRFTAELSHELRTPLARISAETELMLRRERTPDEYRDALDSIQRSADTMARTVEALVAAAQHEAGLTRTTSDVRDVVSSAIGATRQNGALVDIGVSLPDQPVRVAVDGQLAERMLQPLLDNATRYGHVVNVSVVRGNTVASIAIDDDGPGVAGDERDMIFEPGARGSASAGHDGAGLGLALAQRLARSAGGAIIAEPNEGGGRFTLKLPLAP